MSLLTDLFRCLLIYLHLLFFGVAIALVFWGDLRILRGHMKDSDYTFLVTVITRLFLGLWATGLTVIFVDTGFNPVVLAENPKLLTKLACISVLSINAILLHRICLGILIGKSAINLPQALLLSICGAVSTSHWLIAAFIGSANVLEQFSFKALVSTYLGILGIVILVGIAISPHMLNRLNRQRDIGSRGSVDLNLGDPESPNSANARARSPRNIDRSPFYSSLSSRKVFSSSSMRSNSSESA